MHLIQCISFLFLLLFPFLLRLFFLLFLSHSRHGKRSQPQILPQRISNHDSLSLAPFQCHSHRFLQLFRYTHRIDYSHIRCPYRFLQFLRIRKILCFPACHIKTFHRKIPLRPGSPISLFKFPHLLQRRHRNRHKHNLHLFHSQSVRHSKISLKFL